MDEFFCNICLVKLSGKKNAKEHFEGKKHKMKAGIFANQKAAAENSVFVRGFPPGTTEMSLMEYFNQFGSIDKSFLDKMNGKYFIVQFKEKISQQNALNKNSKHLLNGKPIQVIPRLLKQTNLTTKADQNNPGDEIHKMLIENLTKMKSVKEQLLQIAWIITLNNTDVTSRKRFCQTVNKCLKQFYPKCSVAIYGSSVNGYGFKGCDMDLTAILPEIEEFKNVEKPDFAPLNRVPSMAAVTSGEITLEQLYSLSKEHTTQFLRNVVRKSLRNCRNVLYIPSARCPIIRFQSSQLEISCDLSVDKKIGIINTNLFRLLGLLDPRIRPLIVTLRYWAKMKDLLGSGHKFSSYAFTWLIIFYLQRIEPPIISKIVDLQNLTDETAMVEGYQINFGDQVELCPKTTNKDDIVDLLKGFFSFYLTFDFALNAICPKKSEIIDKGVLKDHLIDDIDFKISSVTLQDPLELNHNVTYSVTNFTLVHFLECLENSSKMCKHSDFNKPPGLIFLLEAEQMIKNSSLKRSHSSESNLELAETSFSVPLKEDIFAQFNQQMGSDFELKSLEEKGLFLLAKMCDTIIEVMRTGLLMECKIIENNNIIIEKKEEGEREDKKITDNPRKIEDFKKECAIEIKNEVNDANILINETDPFLCKRFKIGEDEEHLRIKDECLLMSIQCTARHRVWVGRKHQTVSEEERNAKETVLERENRISQIILEKQLKTEKKEDDEPIFNFRVEIMKQKKGELLLLGVAFKQDEQNKSKEFTKNVVNFLYSYMPKTIKTCFADFKD